MFNITDKITTIQDVKSFADYLYKEKSVAFHPDEDFSDYIDNTGNSCFTDKEAQLLNQRMNECFNICSTNDTCIYELMMSRSPLPMHHC